VGRADIFALPLIGSADAFLREDLPRQGFCSEVVLSVGAVREPILHSLQPVSPFPYPYSPKDGGEGVE